MLHHHHHSSLSLSLSQMAFFNGMKIPFYLFLIASSIDLCLGVRHLASLYVPPPTLLTYHKGAILEGEIPISILWYGRFTNTQKSIVADFILSLSLPQQKGVSPTTPSISQWWETMNKYSEMAGKKKAQVILSVQTSDENYSLGKTLKRSQILELATKSGPRPVGVVLVLTDKDVAVEGFCMSGCGSHGSDSDKRWAFVWVGNSETQCPGQCAWPFHQPIYGPQSPPLVAPNDDVGLDGMIVNIAGLLAGTVTNPFGNGYFQGPEDAPLEAASACAGVYGKGAYPGYAGELLVDLNSGASYNAQGVNGRKCLLPALFDPSTSSCSTLV
ncbi:protein PHOSPHATE-INDUCED 1-like [Magnolia sinica]|uniref:protein PHOSPHATE-INDUCED 1-like n=1 Tax=Magnolia sinica TaxID=86752 RepID=UPI0026592FF6|nr:protein PHOSPHATE-INDUCED 1-like [Magnolia sinica]